MNPLDPFELETFQDRLDKTMPFIHEKNARVFQVYGQLPKNFKDKFDHDYNRFLNYESHILYEIAHRKAITKEYVEEWIRHHEGKPMVKGASLPWSGINVGFCSPSTTKVNGAVIETVPTQNDGTQNYKNFVGLFKCPNTGVIGTFYNQIAGNSNTTTGNYHIGAYDDNGNPNNLLADSGSLTVPSGYTYTSVTEFSLTSTQNWLSVITDGLNTWFSHFPDTSGNQRYKTQTYGALPNPAGSGYTNDVVVAQFKMGHT